MSFDCFNLSGLGSASSSFGGLSFQRQDFGHMAVMATQSVVHSQSNYINFSINLRFKRNFQKFCSFVIFLTQQIPIYTELDRITSKTTTPTYNTLVLWPSFFSKKQYMEYYR